MKLRLLAILFADLFFAASGPAEDAGAPSMGETASSASMDLDVLDQTLRVASATEHQDFMSRFRVGMERGRETYALDMELTPRRVGADGI